MYFNELCLENDTVLNYAKIKIRKWFHICKYIQQETHKLA
jgi:hypothetical protein